MTCDPAEVIKCLQKYNATAITGSPAFVERLALHALKQNITLPVRYTGVGGAPVFRGTLRTVSSATPNRKTVVIYGSTEAEPISMIFAAEKMELEASRPDGLCVGQPVFKGTVKVIQILSGIFTCYSSVFPSLSLLMIPFSSSVLLLVSFPDSWHHGSGNKTISSFNRFSTNACMDT